MTEHILVKTRDINGEYHYEPYHNSRPYKEIGTIYCSITGRACDAISCAHCQHKLPLNGHGKTFMELGEPLILDWT